MKKRHPVQERLIPHMALSYIQEVDIEHDVVPMEITVPKTKERRSKFEPNELPPYLGKKKVEPIRVTEPASFHYKMSENDRSTLTIFEAIWLISRARFNKLSTVPDWSGWISKTSLQQHPLKKSEIGYLEPILHPITEYSTVKECIEIAMKATAKLGQRYTFVTMDLAAAKIAYDIVWNEPVKYATVIIHLGAFHTMCSYMGSLGKMMTGSGFGEVLIESGICASGSIEKVMSITGSCVCTNA